MIKVFVVSRQIDPFYDLLNVGIFSSDKADSPSSVSVSFTVLDSLSSELSFAGSAFIYGSPSPISSVNACVRCNGFSPSSMHRGAHICCCQ